MEFALAVFGGLAAILVACLLFARWSPKSGAEILDWKPSQSYEQQLELESDDVEQMIAARNERRRQRGEAEVSEDEFRGEVQTEAQEQRQRAAEYRSEQDS